MPKARLIARRARKPKRGRKPVVRHAYMRSQKDCASRVFKAFQGHPAPGYFRFEDKYGVPQATAQNPALARSIANRVAALSKSLPPGTNLLPALYDHFGLTVGGLAQGSMAAAMQAAAPMYPPNHQATAEIKQFAASVWQHTRAWGMANEPLGYGPHYTGMGSWFVMSVNNYTPSWMGQIILYQLVAVTPALDRCGPGPEMRAPRFGQDEPVVTTMRIPVMAMGLGGTLGWLLARRR